MPKHSKPIDPAGYAAVLESGGKLTLLESAALTVEAREMMNRAGDIGESALWSDLRDLYVAARTIFFREFGDSLRT